MPKLLNNLQVIESNSEAKVDAVFSSLIIAYVFTTYHVNLKKEQNEILLKCLRLPPDKETCSELMKKINEFDHKVLR